MVQRSTPIESDLIVSEQFHDVLRSISIYSKYCQGHFKHHFKNLDYVSTWKKEKSYPEMHCMVMLIQEQLKFPNAPAQSRLITV